MAVNKNETKSFKYGKEPVELGYRKRLWVFCGLLSNGWQLDPEKIVDAKSLDNYLFRSDYSKEFKQNCDALMIYYKKSNFNLAYGKVAGKWGERQPASESAFSWVLSNDHRFFCWVRYYLTQVLEKSEFPFYIEYLDPKYELILWLDDLLGTKEEKINDEVQIKRVWSKKKEINKALSVLNKKGKGVWEFFWKETLKTFEDSGDYSRAIAVNPGFDNPIGDDECYYASVFIYDIADISEDAKIKIIRDINRKWINHKRVKEQVNVSLSSDAAKKLNELKDNAGCTKSEFVERLIRREAQKQG